MAEALLCKWRLLFAILLWPRQLTADAERLTSYVDLVRDGREGRWKVKDGLVSNGPLTKSVDISRFLPDYKGYHLEVDKALVTMLNPDLCAEQLLQVRKDFDNRTMTGEFRNLDLLEHLSGLMSCLKPSYSVSSFKPGYISSCTGDIMDLVTWMTGGEGADTKFQCSNQPISPEENKVRLSTSTGGGDDHWGAAVIVDIIKLFGRAPYESAGGGNLRIPGAPISIVGVLRVIMRDENKAARVWTVTLTFGVDDFPEAVFRGTGANNVSDILRREDWRSNIPWLGWPWNTRAPYFNGTSRKDVPAAPVIDEATRKNVPRAPVMNGTPPNNVPRAPVMNGPTRNNVPSTPFMNGPTRNNVPSTPFMNGPTRNNVPRAPFMNGPTRINVPRAPFMNGPTRNNVPRAPFMNGPTRNNVPAAPGWNVPSRKNVPAAPGWNVPSRKNVPAAPGWNVPTRKNVPAAPGWNVPTRKNVPAAPGWNVPTRKIVPAAPGWNVPSRKNVPAAPGWKRKNRASVPPPLVGFTS